VQSTVTGVVGFTLLGIALANVIPNTFRAAGRTTASAPASGVAAVSTLGWLGFLAGPPIIGAAASATGLPAALVLVVLALVTIALLAPQLEPRRAAGRDLVAACRTPARA
ncbi:MAG: hypothetical protein JO244_11745, partial [Solirubrobacterales bacterium]|nr:hypothetical protein [Solirubrobacterales bacterium]